MSKVSKKPLPDLETLRELLHYNAATGDFTWKKKSSPASQARVGESAGYFSSSDRLIITIHTKRYQASRIAWYMETGQDPGDMVIDHISGVTWDNRLCNLRMVTHTENAQNVKKHKRSGRLMGVTIDKHGKFVARLSSTHLGYFSDFFDAVCARISAQNAAGFHGNHGRAA